MTALSAINPTLADLAKRLDPDGKVAVIVEMLQEQNEALDMIPWVEGNEIKGHRTTVRTGLPSVTWRKAYGGVQPTKSTTAQVVETIGTMEQYAEVDKEVADTNGNAAAFRLTEVAAHIQSMNHEFMQTLIYGNEGTEPEAFTGLAPRFNSLSGAENSQNVLSGGGSDTDMTSIYLVGMGANSVHGIYPKGQTAGLQSEDMAEVTVENIDGNGGRMQAYRNHLIWRCGLSVRDWRYVVRICNIDVSELLPGATGNSANLLNLMVQAVELLQNVTPNTMFLCNRTIRSMLRQQEIEKVAGSTLSMETIAGRRVLAFDGIPVYRTDAILNTESAVT